MNEEHTELLIASPSGESESLKASSSHEGTASSPVFQLLEKLFYEGKLSGTRMATLKAKYTFICESLKASIHEEDRLLQTAKEYNKQVENQKALLEKSEVFPEGCNTEVARLRNELIRHHNELDLTHDRQFQAEFAIENLTEERDMMQREYDRMPKQDEVEREMKEITQTCEDISAEIDKRKSEIQHLREEINTRNRENDAARRVLDTELIEQDDLKNELVALHAIPQQVGKDIDRLKRGLSKLQKEFQDKNQLFLSANQELNDIIKQQENAEIEKQKLDEQTQRIANERELMNHEFQRHVREADAAKERENVLLGDKATFELSLRHLTLEKKNLHEKHSRCLREKDRNLKNLKKCELQLRMAQENLNHANAVYEKTKIMVESYPAEDGLTADRKQEIENEIEVTKRILSQQEHLTASEQAQLQNIMEEERSLRLDEADFRIEVIELGRVAAIKADEKEQKARDYLKAEQRFRRAEQELKTKKIAIEDYKKKNSEMQRKQKEFLQMYDVIKSERQKCIALIQVSTQKAAEMREKIKILENEIEILRTSVNVKERHLQKSRLRRINALVQRDTLRNELSKLHRLEDEMIEKRDQQRRDIAKLTNMIDLSEKQMVALRQRYKVEVQRRNERGVDLIVHNQEASVFYEKINNMEQVLRNGNVELQASEEELKFLQVQLTDVKRSVEISKSNLPSKRAVENELVVLQIQLSECEDRLRSLEAELGDPDIEGRTRLLPGKMESPEHLSSKIANLEERIAEKEAISLEKDLLLEQVSRLSDRLKEKANAGKEDSLNLAKRVNEYQSKIKDLTRKMMAIVSELSMNQANCFQLQQTLKEKEDLLQQSYLRLERGEAPNEDAEEEWQRVLHGIASRKIQREADRIQEQDEEHYKLPNGGVTTAEPRPNAYLPEDESELPIPRPYGAFPPFKPQDPGANMRHIRKPVVKPIEI